MGLQWRRTLFVLEAKTFLSSIAGDGFILSFYFWRHCSQKVYNIDKSFDDHLNMFHKSDIIADYKFLKSQVPSRFQSTSGIKS